MMFPGWIESAVDSLNAFIEGTKTTESGMLFQLSVMNGSKAKYICSSIKHARFNNFNRLPLLFCRLSCKVE